MKSTFILFTMFCIVSNVSAQFDTKNNAPKFSAPLSKNTTPIAPATKKFTFDPAPLKSPLFPDLNAPKQPSINMAPQNEFVNTNDKVKDRLNAEKGSFLGDYKTSGNYVKIVCRDFGEFDGDKVSVFLNDILVTPEVLLQLDYKEVVINLQKGFNKIQFKALNEGYSSPNTAEFVMYDSAGKIITSNQWNLFTGDRATINVTKN